MDVVPVTKRTGSHDLYTMLPEKQIGKLDNVNVDKFIGSGSFGEVYRGLWNNVTPVALKKLKYTDHMKEFMDEAVTLLYIYLWFMLNFNSFL